MSHDYVEIAHEIAKKAHAGQFDKAGIDYIKHPETVASFVETQEQKAAAFLHDTLEDTEVTADDLRAAGIPDEVIEAVELLTHNKKQDYFEYLARVKENPIAKAVKFADLKHNSDLSRLKDITEADKQRLIKYSKAIEYLRA
jgi:(p)ppGpp synthase/HD superfamily hydrolase